MGLSCTSPRSEILNTAKLLPQAATVRSLSLHLLRIEVLGNVPNHVPKDRHRLPGLSSVSEGCARGGPEFPEQFSAKLIAVVQRESRITRDVPGAHS
jgi:hypothetical protein